MTVAQLVGSIARAGGYLRVLQGGTLEYVGPQKVLTDTLREQIRERREAIIAWLRTPIDEQPRVDQLALDYEPTLDEHTRARLFDDSIPDALRVLDPFRRGTSSDGHRPGALPRSLERNGWTSRDGEL